MGERALVAVETDAGEYELYHSQWGGRALVGAISAERAVTEAVRAGRHVGTAPDARSVLDALDPQYEALLVGSGGADAADVPASVETYLVAWLTLELTAQRRPRGSAALVPVDDATTVRRLRAFLRTTTDLLGDAVDAGLVPEEVALAVLRQRVASHPDVPAETVWVSGSEIG